MHKEPKKVDSELSVDLNQLAITAASRNIKYTDTVFANRTGAPVRIVGGGRDVTIYPGSTIGPLNGTIERAEYNFGVYLHYTYNPPHTLESVIANIVDERPGIISIANHEFGLQ